MDWRTLFLSPEGRIGQRDFWIGFLVLFVIGLLAPVLHILAPLVWLVLLFPWVCLFSKRLHDFGKSGFLILIPVVVACLAMGMAIVFGGVTAVSALWTAAEGGAQPSSWAVVAGAVTAMLGFLAVAALAKLIFILWVGLSRGDAGDNRYGPPPASLTRPASPAPTAPV
jgi:uncharacterized membrane protein YhaH (DUF805 family)